eukprot:NODE_1259_length_1807_cov_45.817102_g1194_i0.p1 GENE.NODE_1259_length_1807_cov_45.817102_g1194_i0~~NODE_1259_length_1807_cov_45.817102_g1194_i0.p1  ORF type:complete len:580 (-),score=48.45 NODE_1259_length_1807_cov_45.817102_g1194_i0:4-1743(-)
MAEPRSRRSKSYGDRTPQSRRLSDWDHHGRGGYADYPERNYGPQVASPRASRRLSGYDHGGYGGYGGPPAARYASPSGPAFDPYVPQYPDTRYAPRDHGSRRRATTPTPTRPYVPPLPRRPLSPTVNRSVRSGYGREPWPIAPPTAPWGAAGVSITRAMSPYQYQGPVSPVRERYATPNDPGVAPCSFTFYDPSIAGMPVDESFGASIKNIMHPPASSFPTPRALPGPYGSGSFAPPTPMMGAFSQSLSTPTMSTGFATPMASGPGFDAQYPQYPMTIPDTPSAGLQGTFFGAQSQPQYYPQFQPAHFQPAQFQPAQFQPAQFQPAQFQPAQFQQQFGAFPSTAMPVSSAPMTSGLEAHTTGQRAQCGDLQRTCCTLHAQLTVQQRHLDEVRAQYGIQVDNTPVGNDERDLFALLPELPTMHEQFGDLFSRLELRGKFLSELKRQDPSARVDINELCQPPRQLAAPSRLRNCVNVRDMVRVSHLKTPAQRKPSRSWPNYARIARSGWMPVTVSARRLRSATTWWLSRSNPEPSVTERRGPLLIAIVNIRCTERGVYLQVMRFEKLSSVKTLSISNNSIV